MPDNLDRVNAEIMQNLTGKDRKDFESGLRNLGMTNPVDKADLRAAFERLNPNATERELDIMVAGETPQDNRKAWIA